MNIYYNAKYHRAMFQWSNVDTHDYQVRSMLAIELLNTLTAMNFFAKNISLGDNNVLYIPPENKVGVYIKYHSLPEEHTIYVTLDTENSGYDSILHILCQLPSDYEDDVDHMLDEKYVSKIQEFGKI